MKKLLPVFILFIWGLNPTAAQTEYGETPLSRMYVGGNFGLQLGNFTLIDISPLAGYNLTPWFSAGVGGTYMFVNIRQFNQTFRTNFYGFRGFTRALIGNSFLLHGEYELLNGEDLVPDQSGFLSLQRTWKPAVWVGGGYRTPAGNNSFFTLTVLYNLFDRGDIGDSFYNSPLNIRVGYIFGLHR